MKTFIIGVWEEASGYATIKAKNEEEAKKKAWEILDNEGLAGFKDYDQTHRDTSVLSCEEEAKQ